MSAKDVIAVVVCFAGEVMEAVQCRAHCSRHGKIPEDAAAGASESRLPFLFFVHSSTDDVVFLCSVFVLYRYRRVDGGVLE
jgi:hypothetical protein